MLEAIDVRRFFFADLSRRLLESPDDKAPNNRSGQGKHCTIRAVYQTYDDETRRNPDGPPLAFIRIPASATLSMTLSLTLFEWMVFIALSAMRTSHPPLIHLRAAPSAEHYLLLPDTGVSFVRSLAESNFSYPICRAFSVHGW